MALDPEAIFDHAEQIDGWFPRRPDMETLYMLARFSAKPRGLFLEVGSWKGRSSYVLAAVAQHAGAHLVCVDTWRGYPDRSDRLFKEAEEDENFKRYIVENLSEFGVIQFSAWVEPALINGATVVLEPGVSWERAVGWADKTFDLIFLDGDHDSPGFDRDVVAFWPKVRPGGVLCGHDYGHLDYPDVQRVVDRAFPTAMRAGPVWYVCKA